MTNAWRAFVGASILALAFSSQATHEVDHRYKIFGTVQTADGAPAKNMKVRLTGLGGRPLGETTTNQAGKYEFPLHVHNQDLGTQFWVTVDGRTKAGEITFDPADKSTERVHRIDFPPPGQGAPAA